MECEKSEFINAFAFHDLSDCVIVSQSDGGVKFFYNYIRKESGTLGPNPRYEYVRDYTVEFPATDRTSRVGSRPEIRCLAFSPDGSLLAAAGVRGDIWIWKVSGALPSAYGEGDLWALISMDNSDRQLALWFEPLSCQTSAITFSSDGKRLITGSVDGKVKIWDITRNMALEETPDSEPVPVSEQFTDAVLRYGGSQFFPSAVLSGHNDAVDKVFVSRDSRYMLSFARDGVRIWDFQHPEYPCVWENREIRGGCS